MSYLENARISTIRKFDYSLGQQLRSMSKVYVADPGLYSAKGFKFSEKYGHIAENLVAIELLRKRAFNPILEIYYWKDQQQREVDFVVKEGIRVQQLIQVCWNLNEAKRSRARGQESGQSRHRDGLRRLVAHHRR